MAKAPADTIEALNADILLSQANTVATFTRRLADSDELCGGIRGTVLWDVGGGGSPFCQVLAEQEWEEDYPSRRGEPKKMVDYMTSAGQVPIMTNSESLLQFGNNAYGKPATALNVLRETVLGRELFDCYELPVCHVFTSMPEYLYCLLTPYTVRYCIKSAHCKKKL